MPNCRIGFWAVLIAMCTTSVPVCAKVWLLPDYQQRQLFSHRLNNEIDTSPALPESSRSCAAYGMSDAAEISPGMVCASSATIKNLTCYSDCYCPSEYKYTSSFCRSAGKIPSGATCLDKYTDCICDTSLFPHTSLSCEHTLSGASCSDDDGTHYAECIDTTPCPNGGDSETEKSQKESNGFECVFAYEGYKTSCYNCSDPCEGLVDQDCGTMSCATYYAKCPLKCEVCQIEVSCENGFHQSADKLSCVADACEGYLDSCPANTLCNDTCLSGNNTKYKISGCKIGYIDRTNWFCKNNLAQTLLCTWKIK